MSAFEKAGARAVGTLSGYANANRDRRRAVDRDMRRVYGGPLVDRLHHWSALLHLVQWRHARATRGGVR